MATLPSPVKRIRPEGVNVYRFMDALSGQESGGDYTAENARSKAYGRFQILPSNWPSWSKEAGIGGAEPTPQNQERVAQFKLQQYYDKFKNWEDVASAWYSGQPRSSFTPEELNRKQGAGDGPSIQEYIDSVMARTKQTGSTVNRRVGDKPVADTPKSPIAEVAKKFKTAGTSIFDSPKAVEPPPKAKPTYSPVTSYTPTGKYDDDMNGYNAASQAAWDKLDSITDRIIQIDEGKRIAKAFAGYLGDDGNLYEDGFPAGVNPDVGDDGNPKEVWVMDPEATRILQEAFKWDDQIARLESRRKAGLTQSGDDAAKAYLESEKTKAAEADRKYENFVTRIKDLQAIEDLPTARAMSLATALNAASTANSKRTSQFDPLATVNQGPQTDFSADAKGLRDTMGPAPEFYGMDATGLPGGQDLFPPPDGTVQIPGVPYVPESSEAPGDFDIPNPFPGSQPKRTQVAPTAQTFGNPFSDLARRAKAPLNRSIMR